jgi:hypothetical protein
MLNRPEPHTPFDVRHKEIRDDITDPREHEVFDRAVARIDRQAISAAYEKHKALIKGPGLAGWGKYLDVCFWIRDKVSRAVAMGLMDASPSRVLDLGTGAGHWLAVCGAMGHEAVGLDLEVPLCVDLCAALKVDRRTYRIRRGVALPDLGRFDFITAFAVKFDALGQDPASDPAYWSLEDWNFFLRDVTGRRMRYPGTLHLQLNSRILSSGEAVKFSDVLEACRQAGASVSEVASRIQFQVDGPIKLQRDGAASRSRPFSEAARPKPRDKTAARAETLAPPRR